mmetsp:Transcript_70199/g.198121  ORF Transcript_70199/g.198121 Transcript_70199/m.198121 type:complete len:243 (+) Transcript_70199:163-891(+)
MSGDQCPSASEHAELLATAIMRGLADLTPGGPEITAEGRERREEVLEGIEQIQHILQESERTINEAGADMDLSNTARECCAGRIKWAAGMTSGLKRGVEGLQRVDTIGLGKGEYDTIIVLLRDSEQRVRSLTQVIAPPVVNPTPAALASASASSSEPTPDQARRQEEKKAAAAALDEQLNDTLATEVQRTLQGLGDIFWPVSDLIDVWKPIQGVGLSEAGTKVPFFKNQIGLSSNLGRHRIR